MNTAVKPELNSKTFCSSKNYILLIEKKISYLNMKFYQKLFVVFISLSSFLIIPESPRELEHICENYYSKILCNVW